MPSLLVEYISFSEKKKHVIGTQVQIVWGARQVCVKSFYPLNPLQCSYNWFFDSTKVRQYFFIIYLQVVSQQAFQLFQILNLFGVSLFRVPNFRKQRVCVQHRRSQCNTSSCKDIQQIMHAYFSVLKFYGMSIYLLQHWYICSTMCICTYSVLFSPR